MPTIRQSIEVAAPVHIADAGWPYFVEWMLVGQRKMACGELACVSATESGQVSFEESSGGNTVVAFQLECPDDETSAGRQLLANNLWHDLMLFKDYLENEEYRKAGGFTAALEDKAHRRTVGQQGPGKDPDTLSWPHAF